MITQRVTTQPSCVAGFSVPLFLATCVDRGDLCILRPRGVVCLGGALGRSVER